jgi:hypothetical protein
LRFSRNAGIFYALYFLVVADSRLWLKRYGAMLAGAGGLLSITGFYVWVGGEPRCRLPQPPGSLPLEGCSNGRGFYAWARDAAAACWLRTRPLPGSIHPPVKFQRLRRDFLLL